MVQDEMTKRLAGLLCLVAAAAAIAALLLSAPAQGILSAAGHAVNAHFKELIDRHCITFYTYSFQKSRSHYFLLPDGGYTAAFFAAPLSARSIAGILSAALFNSFFQPVFPCVLTPQMFLNALLFPFFVYAAVRYFRKVPLLVIILVGMYLYAALYGSVVEALVRHRMSCELLYLMLGLAGFMDWITARSSS